MVCLWTLAASTPRGSAELNPDSTQMPDDNQLAGLIICWHIVQRDQLLPTCTIKFNQFVYKVSSLFPDYTTTSNYITYVPNNNVFVTIFP